MLLNALPALCNRPLEPIPSAKGTNEIGLYMMPFDCRFFASVSHPLLARLDLSLRSEHHKISSERLLDLILRVLHGCWAKLREFVNSTQALGIEPQLHCECIVVNTTVTTLR
jgi:hypothetical protein